ncbi:hypothetical protein ALC57_13980 [Trachymyrmex cornetzi]|uniref:Uncharacterized protein n=1 Tax=Trachymyrmex cornetzi TaxID=471704 RepID=A0A195DM40_9HYME|nr:hypothetical protein ALC57_13980 [Trachymyrmex cornetzi]
MKNRVCRGGSRPPPRAEVSRRLRLRDSPTLRDLEDALSPAKANLLDGNTCEPGTSLYVSVCVSMQYYVSKELLKREARTSGFRCWDSRLLEEYRRMSFHTAKPIADSFLLNKKNSGTYWDSITATSAKHAIPTPLKDYPSRCARPYITKKKNLPRGTFTQITTTTHFSLRISVSKLRTTYRNARREDWPPSIIRPTVWEFDLGHLYIQRAREAMGRAANASSASFCRNKTSIWSSLEEKERDERKEKKQNKRKIQGPNSQRANYIASQPQSLYQHDVCYRDVIKCPAVQATTPPGISTHPLCHPRDSHARLSYRVCVAWKGVELRRCVFNGYLSPSLFHLSFSDTQQQERKGGIRKKEEAGRGEEGEEEEEKEEEERKDTRWLLYNEPAATRGNRNNYAKTERNGASRAKGKRRRMLWDGAYKRSKPN